jgi:hypothetical protein
VQHNNTEGKAKKKKKVSQSYNGTCTNLNNKFISAISQREYHILRIKINEFRRKIYPPPHKKKRLGTPTVTIMEMTVKVDGVFDDDDDDKISCHKGIISQRNLV